MPPPRLGGVGVTWLRVAKELLVITIACGLPFNVIGGSAFPIIRLTMLTLSDVASAT